MKCLNIYIEKMRRRTVEMNNTVKELVGEKRMGEFSKECLEKDCSNVDILGLVQLINTQPDSANQSSPGQ
jgi:hypothetical protein